MANPNIIIFGLVEFAEAIELVIVSSCFLGLKARITARAKLCTTPTGSHCIDLMSRES